jgi:hypothetical protein
LHSLHILIEISFAPVGFGWSGFRSQEAQETPDVRVERRRQRRSPYAVLVGAAALQRVVRSRSAMSRRTLEPW